MNPDGLEVLDVGAGQGAFVRALNELGARAVGVEIEAAKVARAREESGCEVVLGSAEALPFEDNAFDVLTYMFSLHHVPASLHERTFAEAARVLRPGGQLYVCEPEIGSDMSQIVAVIDDETEVRQAALAALDAYPARYGFERLEERHYMLTRHYVDFDALASSLVAVDGARAAKLDAARDEMERRFQALSTHGAAGYSVRQRVGLFRFGLSTA